MLHPFSRMQLIVGEEAVQHLSQMHVAVFGIGGVGSAAVEAIARAGIGKMTLIDNDVVSETNKNRQLVALSSTVGLPKVEIMRNRILDINPNATITALRMFYDSNAALDLTQFDYIIDAIDTVSAKLLLIETCNTLHVPLICSMGTGNKVDPTQFEVADIFKTSVCPLARVIRCECRKRGIHKLKVVYSKEAPRKPHPSTEKKGTAGHPVPGSISFVPPVAGMILAGQVICDLMTPYFV